MTLTTTSAARDIAAFREFFDGSVKAWAVFDDPFGVTRRSMTITADARSEDGTIILDETIRFDDGEEDARIWRLTPGADGALDVEANDVREARGRIDGRTLVLDYVFDMTVNGRVVPVRVEDKMTLSEDDVLIARSRFRKFGLPLGRMTAVFMRETPARTEAAAMAA